MNNDLSPDELLATVELAGFRCQACSHSHSGARLAYICVGCPCEMVPDFDKMRANGMEDNDSVLDADVIE